MSRSDPQMIHLSLSVDRIERAVLLPIVPIVRNVLACFKKNLVCSIYIVLECHCTLSTFLSRNLRVMLFRKTSRKRR